MIVPNNDFWKEFKETNGAFSTAEAIALINIANQASSGYAYEFGSHRGKSSMAIAFGLRDNILSLVEPEFNDVNWDKEVYDRVSGVNENVSVETMADNSLDVIPYISEHTSFVFIDSGVHDDMVMDEVKGLEDRMKVGGIIAFHDFLNQFTAVERAYRYLLSTGKYEEIPINWEEIFSYVKENNLEDGNKSWHQYPELPYPPNFVGALRRKQ